MFPKHKALLDLSIDSQEEYQRKRKKIKRELISAKVGVILMPLAILAFVLAVPDITSFLHVPAILLLVFVWLFHHKTPLSQGLAELDNTARQQGLEVPD